MPVSNGIGLIALPKPNRSPKMTSRRPALCAAVVRAPRFTAVLLATMLLFGAALAVAAVRAGKYSGTTSERLPVTLTIAASKKTINHFNALLAYNGKCGPGGGPGLTASPATISIGHGGSFSKDVTLSLSTATPPIHDPGRVFGKVSGSRVTGTVEQFLNGKVNKCYVETFSANRR
jgi:hypothetical protein